MVIVNNKTEKFGGKCDRRLCFKRFLKIKGNIFFKAGKLP